MSVRTAVLKTTFMGTNITEAQASQHESFERPNLGLKCNLPIIKPLDSFAQALRLQRATEPNKGNK